MSPGRAAPGRTLAPFLLPLAPLGICLLAAAVTLTPLATNDLWVHLASGREAVASLQRGEGIPVVEQFSFTAAGRPLVPHEWLTEILFHLSWVAGGAAGVQVLRLGLVLAILAALAWAARRSGIAGGPAAWAIVLFLLAAAPRLVERPHLVSWLLSALVLGLLAGALAPAGSPRAPARPILESLTLGTIVALWVNLHGGYVIGGALIAGAVAAAGLARGRCVPGTIPRLLIALAAGLLAGALVHPSKFEILLFPATLAGSDVVTERVLEWRSPFVTTYWSTTPFLLTALIALILAAYFVARFRSRTRTGARQVTRAAREARTGGSKRDPKSRPSSAPPDDAPAAGAIAGPLRSGPDAWTIFGLLVTAGFGLLAVRQIRSVADFALLTVPWTAAAIAAIPPRFTKLVSAPLAGLFALAASGLVTVFGYPVRPDMRVRPIPPLVASHVPVAAAEFIAGMPGLPSPARIFNSYTLGGYLEWRLHPSARVLIDSRNEAYGDELTDRILGAFRDAWFFREALEKWQPDLVVLAWRQITEPAVLSELGKDPGWKLVFLDDANAVWAPAGSRLQRLAFVSPLGFDPRAVTPDRAREAVAEGERMLTWQPAGVMGSLVAGWGLMQSGEDARARTILESSAAADPDSPALWSSLARARSRTGDASGAAAAEAKAAALSAKAPARNP